MISDITATGTDHDGRVDLEVIQGKFKGCVFNYDQVSFGEEENSDGTYTMHFEYNIVNDFQLNSEDKDEFVTFLGDTLVGILEEQIRTSDVVYKVVLTMDYSKENVESICTPFIKSIADNGFRVCLTKGNSIVLLLSDTAGGDKPIAGMYWSGDEWVPAKWDNYGSYIDVDTPRGLDLVLFPKDSKEHA